VIGHVGIDALMPGRGDGVALDERAACERALKRLGRALEPDVRLRGREDHSSRWFRFGLSDFDIIAGADPCVCALEAIEADDVDAFVFAIGPDRAGGGRPISDNLDHVAFGEAELFHQLVWKARETAAAVCRRQARHLYLA